MIFVWLVALGCGSRDSDAPVCREGTTLQADGHCHPPIAQFPPSLRDALEALPACEPAGPGPAIDVARGCANAACAGDLYADMVEALGDQVTCATAAQDVRLVYCTWEELGIDGLFRDEDQNRVPDAQARTDRIHLFVGHLGALPGGGGIASNLSCFVDELGVPSRMNTVDVAGHLLIRELIYDELGLFAYDLGDDDESGLPNGYVDNIYLYGQ